jgi:hypothetical protein
VVIMGERILCHCRVNPDGHEPGSVLDCTSSLAQPGPSGSAPTTDLEVRQAATIRRQRAAIQDLHRRLASAREYEEAALRVAYRAGARDEDVTAQIAHDRELRRLAAAREDVVSEAYRQTGAVAALAGRLRAAPDDVKMIPVSAVLAALDGVLAGRKGLRLPEFPIEPPAVDAVPAA